MNTVPERPDLSASAWQRRYDEQQTGWDRGEPNPALFRWLDTGDLCVGNVLVPGCGRGHEVVELVTRGFDVTAIDFAKSATQALTKRLIERGLVADVVRESVLRYAADEPFDAIYEQTCLCAIDPKHWPAYERRLHNWLKRDGKLFALFMQTGAPDGPPFHCDLDTMKSLFAGDSWRWPDEHFTVDHPTGMKEIAVILTKFN